MQRAVRQSAKSKRRARKIVLIGSSKSGKTCLARRFIFNTFEEEHVETIEDTLRLDYSYRGYNLNLEIIDLSGAFNFPVMRDLHIKAADAILLVYELENLRSAEEIRAVFPIIKNLRPDNVPIVFVGTKGDLCKKPVADSAETTKLLSDLRSDLELKHTITSSRCGTNVVEAFELALEGVIKKIRTLSYSAQGGYSHEKRQVKFCCF